MHIRPFRIGDESDLFAVFHSSIHGLAARDYSADQINAWAPDNLDQDVWRERMQGISPFVVEHDAQIVGYADIQPDGYIDHFFVSAKFARMGVGRMLMQHLHVVAAERSIATLCSDVSRTAQPFFERFGFLVVEQRAPIIRGVVVPNLLMHKTLVSDTTVEGIATSCACVSSALRAARSGAPSLPR
ncbi:GNAT family N-acetyltransferase [Rubrivivax gelatinosus]|uniref:GNAT family N-acetyltransferase n=1 Tax=Rubrivivax gelatinosus TaxID=28068 RepID=UPI0010517AF2|nr:GNAT family N-acetyltransferase [Rubrivivax gelatinosus]MBK1690197.1 GNAT family N-acetyltransferase [Rubrivivax gelatinosus]